MRLTRDDWVFAGFTAVLAAIAARLAGLDLLLICAAAVIAPLCGFGLAVVFLDLIDRFRHLRAVRRR